MFYLRMQVGIEAVVGGFMIAFGRTVRSVLPPIFPLEKWTFQ